MQTEKYSRTPRLSRFCWSTREDTIHWHYDNELFKRRKKFIHSVRVIK